MIFPGWMNKAVIWDGALTASPHTASTKRMEYLRAKMLGGCGNHNDCAFLRPPDSDFDLWAEMGAEGWEPNSVAPFFERVDCMVNIDTNPPLNNLSSAFIHAGTELGLPEVNFRDGRCFRCGPLSIEC